jgi:hypothetical protein
MVETNYRKKILKKTAIDAIIKNVKNGKNTEDQRHLNTKKKTVRTPALITPVASAIEEDHWLSIESLEALGRSLQDGSQSFSWTSRHSSMSTS